MLNGERWRILRYGMFKEHVFLRVTVLLRTTHLWRNLANWMVCRLLSFMRHRARQNNDFIKIWT